MIVADRTDRVKKKFDNFRKFQDLQARVAVPVQQRGCANKRVLELIGGRAIQVRFDLVDLTGDIIHGRRHAPPRSRGRGRSSPRAGRASTSRSSHGCSQGSSRRREPTGGRRSSGTASAEGRKVSAPSHWARDPLGRTAPPLLSPAYWERPTSRATYRPPGHGVAPWEEGAEQIITRRDLFWNANHERACTRRNCIRGRPRPDTAGRASAVRRRTGVRRQRSGGRHSSSDRPWSHSQSIHALRSLQFAFAETRTRLPYFRQSSCCPAAQ